MSYSIVKKFVNEVLLAESETTNDKSKLALAMVEYGGGVDEAKWRLTLYEPNIILDNLEKVVIQGPEVFNSGEDEFILEETVFTLDAIKAYMLLGVPLDPCNGSLEVRASAGVAGSGLGRYLYSVGMYLSNNKGLISDRESVKPAAQKVWKNYNSNNIPRKMLDDIENPQTPDKSDDCVLHYGRDFLNYSYIDSGIDPTSNITIHDETVVKILQMFRTLKYAAGIEDINNMLTETGRSFFTKRYHE